MNDDEDLENDLEENEQDSEDVYSLETPLAKEFAQLCQDVGKQINAKVVEARKALREAEEIAEQHGVPFRAAISPLGNSYVPRTFGKSKFAKLDEEVVCEIAGVWGEYISEMFGGYGGWLHSQVC